MDVLDRTRCRKQSAHHPGPPAPAPSRHVQLHFRQPTTRQKKMALPKPASSSSSSAMKHATHSRSSACAQSEVTQQGYKLARAALLLASGRPLPSYPKFWASHSIIHAPTASSPRSPAPCLRPQQSGRHQNQRPRASSHRLHDTWPKALRLTRFVMTWANHLAPLDPRRKIRHRRRLARARSKTQRPRRSRLKPSD